MLFKYIMIIGVLFTLCSCRTGAQYDKEVIGEWRSPIRDSEMGKVGICMTFCANGKILITFYSQKTKDNKNKKPYYSGKYKIEGNIVIAHMEEDHIVKYRYKTSEKNSLMLTGLIDGIEVEKYTFTRVEKPKNSTTTNPDNK